MREGLLCVLFPLSLAGLPLATVSLATVSLATVSHAQVQVFHADFESGMPSAFAPGVAQIEPVQGFAGLGPVSAPFAGNFLRSPTGNVVQLTLTGLPPHVALDLQCLFAAIDSLDGTGTYPQGDFLRIRLDGRIIFDESFANALPSQVQSYQPPAAVVLARRVDLGFGGPGSFFTDSAYDFGADPRFANLPHTATTAVFDFEIRGPGIQPLNDESWAIDEVRILARTTQSGTAADYGTSCGPILHSTDPRVLGTFTVTASNLAPSATAVSLSIGASDVLLAGATPLPLPLDVLGMSGCWMLHDSSVIPGVSVPMQGSTAALTLPLPNTSLLGVQLFLQAWVLAPGTTALGVQSSNGVRIVIGF